MTDEREQTMQDDGTFCNLCQGSHEVVGQSRACQVLNPPAPNAGLRRPHFSTSYVPENREHPAVAQSERDALWDMILDLADAVGVDLQALYEERL